MVNFGRIYEIKLLGCFEVTTASWMSNVFLYQEGMDNLKLIWSFFWDWKYIGFGVGTKINLSYRKNNY